jgi:8-oxo-dGTP diphosphatase
MSIQRQVLPEENAPPVLKVAAGVILDHIGRVLIAKRPAHVHQGDLWEFPGGKLEPGETGEQALRRELKEELDIEVVATSPLIGIRHAYSDRRVRLDVWRVERFSGIPKGLQGQPIRWAAPDELPGLAFPAANRPIVTAARLPDHYAIIDARSDNPAVVRDWLERLVTAGIQWVRLRPNGITMHQYRYLAEGAIDFCRAHGLRLLLSGDPELVRRTGAAGLHLRSDQLMALRARPLAPSFWLAASCHDRAELRQAKRIGADFAVLGPVCPTTSHPGAEPLGWAGFQSLAEEATIPVFALGGLRSSDVGEAKRRGGQGVAAIRGFLERSAP